MASSADNLTDEIIKRRLLIDGDGMGDERKLNTLLKTYLGFVDGEDDTEENDTATLKRMIGQASQLDYMASRAHVAIKVNEEAKDVYEELQTQVKSEIHATKAQIVESKALLEEATKHRKYSMEYDALAKLIESKPDRKMQELKTMGLQLELDIMKRRKHKLDLQLNERKRTIQQMGQNIEMVKEHLKVSDDKFIRRQTRTSRPKNGDGDAGSTSHSEPPSPMEPTASQEIVSSTVATPVNGTQEILKSIKMEVGSPSAAATEQLRLQVLSTVDKIKSEKYEDLSESEGDDHS